MITLIHIGKEIRVNAFYHEGRAMFTGTPQHRKPLEMGDYIRGKAKPNYPPPAIPLFVNIQPCAVWVYELPDEMTERITYLAFDYLNSSEQIWG